MAGSQERPYANTTCPYCDAELDPLPKSRKRCPSCRQPVHVRSQPDGMTHLIKASDVPAAEEAWEEYRIDQAYRDAIRELHDVEGAAEIEAEFRAKGRTSRDILWALLDHNLLLARRGGDWAAISDAYDTMAVVARDETEPEADLDRARQFLREARLAELRDLASNFTNVIVAADCARCRPGSEQARPIRAEIEHPRLPHLDCENDLCGCRFAVAVEATLRSHITSR